MKGLEIIARRRMASADGLTMIEVLLAAAIGLVVIGGTIGIMTSGIRSEPRLAERTTDIQGARVAMERLTREIRQGQVVTSATGSQLSLVTNVNSATCGGAGSTEVRLCHVTYTCSASQCTRSETNPDGTGTPSSSEIVVHGVSGAAVFSYAPSSSAPQYVAVRLEFPSMSGGDSITLTDGVAMRNAGPSS